MQRTKVARHLDLQRIVFSALRINNVLLGMQIGVGC